MSDIVIVPVGLPRAFKLAGSAAPPAAGAVETQDVDPGVYQARGNGPFVVVPGGTKAITDPTMLARGDADAPVLFLHEGGPLAFATTGGAAVTVGLFVALTVSEARARLELRQGADARRAAGGALSDEGY